MARRLGRSPFAQETIGFLLAAYLRFVQRTNRFDDRASRHRRGHRGPDAAHRRHVARTASDDAVGPPDYDGSARGAHLPPRRRRRPGFGRRQARHHAGARLGRPGRSRLLQGRRVGDARTHAPARIRRLGRDDRRRAEAGARRRAWDRRAGEALGPSDRADRCGGQPAHPVQHLGSRHARLAVRARGASSSATSSEFRPTPTTRRWRRRGSRSSKGSTRCTGELTPWSARPTPARI